MENNFKHLQKSRLIKNQIYFLFASFIVWNVLETFLKGNFEIQTCIADKLRCFNKPMKFLVIKNVIFSIFEDITFDDLLK